MFGLSDDMIVVDTRFTLRTDVPSTAIARSARAGE